MDIPTVTKTPREPDSDDGSIYHDKPQSVFSQQEIDAITNFISGKQNSMRNILRNNEYDAAKTLVYKLDVASVVSYIGENAALSNQINTQDKKWNHLQKLFVAAVRQKNHPLYQRGVSMGAKNLFLEVIKPNNT